MRSGCCAAAAAGGGGGASTATGSRVALSCAACGASRRASLGTACTGAKLWSEGAGRPLAAPKGERAAVAPSAAAADVALGFAADITSDRRPERAGRFRSGSSLSSSAGTKARLSWRPGSAADKRSCQFSRAAWQHTPRAGRTSHSAVAVAAFGHGCGGALRAAAGARREAAAQVDKLRT